MKNENVKTNHGMNHGFQRIARTVRPLKPAVSLTKYLISFNMSFISRLNRWLNSKEASLNAWSSVITIISFPLIIIGLVVGYFQLKDIFTLSDVELNFVHPQSISYRLVNNSSKIAEDILVSFGIFDLDSNPAGLVPIPSIEYDYVNKESVKGPFTFFQKFAKKNHRYFGIVYVGCKGCNKRGRWFQNDLTIL